MPRGFKRRLEPFGATKKRSKKFEQERRVKNRIHELEQALAASERSAAHLTAELVEAKRKVDAGRPHASQLAALRAFATLPMTIMIELGLDREGAELARWALNLECVTVLQASGQWKLAVTDGPTYAEAVKKAGER